MDADVDGVSDVDDNCPDGANADQADVDEDGLGNVCDTCPNDPENDADEDGVCGDADVCPGSNDTVDIDEDGTPDCQSLGR